MATIQHTTYDLLRGLGLTTFFGNVGSTEEAFLRNFPPDFSYILGLHEAVVVGMADGYALATGRPGFVNVHTSAGLGNTLGNLMTTFLNKTPLILTAGQQTREMLLLEPWLTNVEAETFPKPWVKWSYQPSRPEDVPAAIMRAYAIAMQPPQGPVFLSLPLDDWDKPSLGPTVVRSVATRVAPDPERLRAFADRLNRAKAPVLVYGSAVDRSDGWEVGVKLAEKLRAPVWCAPACERTPFPEDHPHFQGNLPFAIRPLSEKLEGHDLVLVVGAPVFSYYPHVPGDYLPAGTELLHIPDDPNESARAPVGDSLIADAALALAALTDLVAQSSRAAPKNGRIQPSLPPQESAPLTANEVYSVLAEVKPADAVLFEETPSNRRELHQWWAINTPRTFFTASSGGLGWAMPAGVGFALGDRALGQRRHIIVAVGDGSFQFAFQALWSAVQHELPVVFLVPRNGEYAILRAFAVAQNITGVPGLALPGLDIVSLAKGYLCPAVRAEKKADVRAALIAAFRAKGPTVIEVPVAATIPKLV